MPPLYRSARTCPEAVGDHGPRSHRRAAAPAPRPAEHHFGKYSAGEQTHELRPDNRNLDWDQGVPEGVLPENAAFGEPFGAGGADEILAEHLDHACPRYSGNQGDMMYPESDGRQRQVMQVRSTR